MKTLNNLSKSSVIAAFFVLLGGEAAAGPILSLDEATPVELDRSEYSWSGAPNKRNAGTLVVTRTGRFEPLVVQMAADDPRSVDIRNNALLPGAAMRLSTFAYDSRSAADPLGPGLSAPPTLPLGAGDGGDYSRPTAAPVVERLAFDDLDTAQVLAPLATPTASDDLVGLLAVAEPPAVALTVLGLLLTIGAARLLRHRR